MNTIIELFDEENIENIVSCFAMLPEKIIFIGYKIPEKKRRAIEGFIKGRGIDVKLDFVTLKNRELMPTIDTINKIIDENPDCAIELTGGEELIAAAIGAVAVEREIPVFSYNLKKHTPVGILNFESEARGIIPKMTVEDGVILHCGGLIQYDDSGEWDMTDDFVRDIMSFWEVYSKKCGAWNMLMTDIGDIDYYSSEDCLDKVRTNLVEMAKDGYDIHIKEKMMYELERLGYIYDFSLSNGIVSFRYKSRQHRRILIKAGNLFELYMRIAAESITINDEKYFNDVRMGVYIDWDGITHEPGEKIKDTVNEIDIAAMHDIIPVFISCKSGEVKKEALYELQTVAEKFGGVHAKKILATTYISNTESKEYIKQRAQDMGISVIEKIHRKTFEQVCKEIMHNVM